MITTLKTILRNWVAPDYEEDKAKIKLLEAEKQSLTSDLYEVSVKDNFIIASRWKLQFTLEEGMWMGSCATPKSGDVIRTNGLWKVIEDMKQ